MVCVNKCLFLINVESINSNKSGMDQIKLIETFCEFLYQRTASSGRLWLFPTQILEVDAMESCWKCDTNNTPRRRGKITKKQKKSPILRGSHKDNKDYVVTETDVVRVSESLRYSILIMTSIDVSLGGSSLDNTIARTWKIISMKFEKLQVLIM